MRARTSRARGARSSVGIACALGDVTSDCGAGVDAVRCQRQAVAQCLRDGDVVAAERPLEAFFGDKARVWPYRTVIRHPPYESFVAPRNAKACHGIAWLARPSFHSCSSESDERRLNDESDHPAADPG